MVILIVTIMLSSNVYLKWSHLLDTLLNYPKHKPHTPVPWPSHAPYSHGAVKAKEYIWYHCLHWLTGTHTEAYTVLHRGLSLCRPVTGRDTYAHSLNAYSSYHNTRSDSLKTSVYQLSKKDRILCEVCLVFVYSFHPKPFCGRPASRG